MLNNYKRERTVGFTLLEPEVERVNLKNSLKKFYTAICGREVNIFNLGHLY